MNPTASCSQYKQDFSFVLSMTYIKVIFDAKSNLCMCDNNAWMAKIHQIGAKSQKSILWPKLSFLNPQNGHKYYKNPLGVIPISFFILLY